MKPGDLILADKGFLLHDILPKGVSVNIPPFLTTQQFTKEQVVETTRIARARIVVIRNSPFARWRHGQSHVGRYIYGSSPVCLR